MDELTVFFSFADSSDIVRVRMPFVRAIFDASFLLSTIFFHLSPLLIEATLAVAAEEVSSEIGRFSLLDSFSLNLRLYKEGVRDFSS